MRVPYRVMHRWRRLWLRRAGPDRLGRWACRMAALGCRPYYARHVLAGLSPRGYFDYRAQLEHPQFEAAEYVFVDENVLVFQDRDGGPVRLGPHVHLHRGTLVQTGAGGSLSIGARSSIQANCHFAAYLAPIRIGAAVQIAPNCAFFSYNHSTALGRPMREQPLRSAGGIEVGDDAWLGAGVTVLDGAHIGAGAVIAAGAVVTGEIPARAIAAGVPARVVRMRAECAPEPDSASTARWVAGHG